jgi:hypothetical protein
MAKMKHVYRFFLLILFASGTLITSCQKESLEIIDETDDNTEAINSDLMNLLLRATMNEGDVDDFIMLGDCFTIAFPFTIIIDGIEVVVEGEQDYTEIIIIIEETGADIDDIEIVFPITLILSDYTEVVVNNLQELEQILGQCQGNNNRIDCVDFVYPLTVFRYNENTENSDTIIIDDDEEMYLLLSNLQEGDHITFQYPISVILLDGSVVEINNNDELEVILDDCSDTINEDVIESYLTNGNWYVGYFFNGEINTTDYCEYVLSFFENKTVLISDGNVNYYGEWIILENDGVYYLNLNFDTYPLEELNNEWLIIEASIEIMGLERVIDLNTVDVLIFSREPSSDC